MEYVAYTVESTWNEVQIIGIYSSMGEAEDAVLDNMTGYDQGRITEVNGSWVGDTFELVGEEFQVVRD